MSENEDDAFDREINKLKERLPGRFGRFLHWLQKPASRWIRLPLGGILILGGIFSFMPILGLWMLPLGLILLAQDLPFLRGPVTRGLRWTEHAWIKYRAMRGKKNKRQ